MEVRMLSMNVVVGSLSSSYQIRSVRLTVCFFVPRVVFLKCEPSLLCGAAVVLPFCILTIGAFAFGRNKLHGVATAGYRGGYFLNLGFGACSVLVEFRQSGVRSKACS